MKKYVAAVALAGVLFVGGAGTAFAHPEGAEASNYKHEPALTGIGHADGSGVDGISRALWCMR